MDATDLALRHLAHALILGRESLPQKKDDMIKANLPAKPTKEALEYFQRRIGVPRDLSYPAARQLRSHITWAIEEALPIL